MQYTVSIIHVNIVFIYLPECSTFSCTVYS